MGKFWAAFVVWWQGKKTIVGGVLVAAAGVAGVATGKLDPVTGLGVVGAGVSIAGYAAKLNRYQSAALSTLQDVAQAGIAARTGGIGAAARYAEGVGLTELKALTPGEVSSAIAATPANSLHISADSVAELLTAVQSLAAQPAPAAPAAAAAPAAGATAK